MISRMCVPVWLVAIAGAAAAEQVSFHIHGFGETAAEVLAAKEMHRYLRVLTGNHNHKLHAHAAGDADDVAGLVQQSTRFNSKVSTGPYPTVVVLASSAHPVHAQLAQLDQAYRSSLSRLSSSDSHLMQTVHLDHESSLIALAGYTPRATLYAAYSLLEHLGMRFYLHGDVAPPANSSLRFPRSLKRVLTPKFGVRGLQPFHDFPMGPDYWQPQFWRALSTQMAKMKLNMWGFHTYPVPKGGTGGHAEPLVWIGTADGYNHTDGSVHPSAGYQTSWYQTQDYWTSNTHTTEATYPVSNQ